MRHHTADQARPWRISIVPLLALVGVFALAGCGSSKSSSSSETTPATTPPATTTAKTESTAAPSTASGALSLEANPEGQLKYNTTSLSAKAGAVSIDFKNTSPIGHNVTIESSSGSTVGATPTFSGESKTLKVTLKPGNYKFYCSVPGRRMAGMEGTLTIK